MTSVKRENTTGKRLLGVVVGRGCTRSFRH